MSSSADDLKLAIDAAVAAERARCAKLARNGAKFARGIEVSFITPAKYAADLADDIADAIEAGAVAEAAPVGEGT